MSSNKYLKFFVNTHTGQDLSYDDAPDEIRELDILLDYLSTNHPNVFANYESQRMDNDLKIKIGQLEDLMLYLCDNYNDVLVSYMITCKPTIWTEYMCEKYPEGIFEIFKQMGIGVIPCDELEELACDYMKEKGLDTSKREIRVLLETTMGSCIEGFDSSIMKIGDKEYYVGYSLTEKAKVDIEHKKANKFVQDNIHTFLQQYENRIRQLESKLASIQI